MFDTKKFDEIKISDRIILNYRRGGVEVFDALLEQFVLIVFHCSFPS